VDRISGWVWQILDIWLAILISIMDSMMFNEAEPTLCSRIHEDASWFKIILAVLFFTATLLRLDDIQAPGHLLDREYTSAIFARAYYFTNNDNIESWRRDIAITTKNQQPVLEPPLVEYLVSVIYRIMAKEEIYYSRYLTNAFWLIGGVFIYLIAKKLLSPSAALIATAYHLFVPMGVIISRSFQPDSLMMMLFLISLYLTIIYFDRPAANRLLLASAVAGITLLIRPLVVFAIFGAFLALSVRQNRNLKQSINMPLIVFSSISLLPAVIYYGYGIVFAGFMRWKISTSFMPYLLTKKDFWLGWFQLGADVVGPALLLLAIVGFFFIQNKNAQYLVVGLTASYVIFGVTFTYHIHTHPYYHVQLVPVIGLCIAPVIIGIVDSLRELPRKTWLVPVSAVLLIALYFSYREVHDSLYQVHLEDPTTAHEIGEIVHHSPHTVFVSNYYGVPLEYYGEFGGAPWPVRIEDAFYRRPGERELSVEERIHSLGFTPEYFVITHFKLFANKDQDLKAYLEKNCTRVAQKDQFLIYATCKTSQ
jgi:4-amino-4-deoxy-L-arabinose transferase-like glycosyltransferase